MKLSRKSYILVLGIGRSGLSMARFLHAKGFPVKATDIDASKGAEAVQLNDLGIETQIGFHNQATFDRAGTIVVSPGIPPDLPYLRRAAGKGVPIAGELDIFTRYNQTKVVAITGTNGKTTVTTLTAEMLGASGCSVFTGGNIGTPLVDYLMQPGPCDVVVAEVSSFQLDLATEFKPEVGVLLNLAEDHLDRYDGMAGYARSKWSIFNNQTGADIAVLNRALEKSVLGVPELASTVRVFSSDPGDTANPDARITADGIEFTLSATPGFSIPESAMDALPGLHNRENVAAAALASLSAGATPAGILEAVRHFRGLPHRVTRVGEVNGVQFYNDSKATNTDAVIRALDCFDGNVILILGGREKGTDFTDLLPSVERRVNTIIAIGEAAPHIRRVLSSVCDVRMAASMDDAVATGFAAARSGDTVLLSPACASFDMYDNYGARGDHFTALVKGIDHG